MSLLLWLLFVQLLESGFAVAVVVVPRCRATYFKIDDQPWFPWPYPRSALAFPDRRDPFLRRVIIDSVSCPVAEWQIGGRCCLATVYARSKTSDVSVLQQIFVEDYGSMLLDLLAALQNQSPDEQLRILDGGGNAGYVTVLIASMFPRAKILTIEPHPDNFRHLKRNTRQFPFVRPLNLALWGSNDTILDLFKRSGHWGFYVKEVSGGVSSIGNNDGNTVASITVTELMQRHQIAEFEHVKLDIEGAEYELFSGPTVEHWVRKVKSLSIELHEHWRKGAVDAVHSGMNKTHSMVFFSGEKELWLRKDLEKALSGFVTAHMR